MARRTQRRKTIGSPKPEKGIYPRRLRESARWDEAMKLGIVGLIAAFVFRVFWDTYIQLETPDYNYALYHGLVFGLAVSIVWRFWPWKRD